MNRVFNFSGGASSALMTILYYRPGDIVLFCDTGREHEGTYKFIKDFSQFENIPVVTISYVGGFRALIKKRKMLPNIAMRFCTIELKVKTARRWLRFHRITRYKNFIGFRGGDEGGRIRNYKEHWKTVSTVFPLGHEITRAFVNKYWDNKPYKLEVPRILGNCDLCFLKGVAAIISILRKEPWRADKWMEDERIIGATYIKGISYKEMLRISQLPYSQQIDLFDVLPAFSCSCST